MKKILLAFLMLTTISGISFGSFAVNSAQPISATRKANTISNPIFVSAADSASLDAFGRQRVSNIETIFDSKNIYDDPDISSVNENTPLFYDNQETSGSGTSTRYEHLEAATYLIVSANTAGTRVRQTRRRFNYQPGKSMLINMSFVMGTQSAGIVKSEGLFDENNGLFLKDSGVDYGFVVRSNTSGTPTDIFVSQNNWNVDKLDGTGESGITIDFTKAQILIIDYEWLGVGRIRFGFNINGKTYFAHYINNANNLSKVYMSEPNLPLRSEITNSGTGVQSQLIQICSTIGIEGGQNTTGIQRSVNTGGTEITCVTENARVAILGIRLKSAYIGETIEILKSEIQIQTASEKILWELWYEPTVNGTFTYSDVSRSGLQYAVGGSGNTVTGGYLLDSGFGESGGVPAGSSGRMSSRILNALSLGSSIDGTPDELVLTVTPVGGTSGVAIEASITYQELK